MAFVINQKGLKGRSTGVVFVYFQEENQINSLFVCDQHPAGSQILQNREILPVTGPDLGHGGSLISFEGIHIIPFIN